MANILIFPVNRAVDTLAVAHDVAKLFNQAEVFNPFVDLARTNEMLNAGKCDDWLDNLVSDVAHKRYP